jgi:hypothetical protein
MFKSIVGFVVLLSTLDSTVISQEIRRSKVLETEFEYKLDNINWKRVDELFAATHVNPKTAYLFDSERFKYGGFGQENKSVDRVFISRTLAYFRSACLSINDYPHMGFECSSIIEFDPQIRVSRWKVYVWEENLASGEGGYVDIVEIDGKIVEPTRRLIKETKVKLPDGTMFIQQLTIELSKQRPVEITGKVLTKYSAVDTARSALLKENPALHKLLGQNEANVTEIVIDGRCGWLVWFSSSDDHVRYEAPFPAWLPKELSQDHWDTWEDGEGSLSVLPVLVWENGQVNLGIEKPCPKWEVEH